MTTCLLSRTANPSSFLMVPITARWSSQFPSEVLAACKLCVISTLKSHLQFFATKYIKAFLWGDHQHIFSTVFSTKLLCSGFWPLFYIPFSLSPLVLWAIYFEFLVFLLMLLYFYFMRLAKKNSWFCSLWQVESVFCYLLVHNLGYADVWPAFSCHLDLLVQPGL